MNITIVSINIGKPTTMSFKESELFTGIFKSPTKEPLYLSRLNFDGDGQADLVHHGGKDKAVCVYSYEHYPYWERNLNRPLVQGAFGENLTVTGMLENDVCIGDIYHLDEAIVQVSQPRQPCHKLAKKYDTVDLPIRVQNTGYTGFYFRVLKEGKVSQTNGIILLERHPKEISVAFANQIMHHEKDNVDGIFRLLEVEELSQNWRTTFEKRLAGKAIDTKNRLEG